MQKEKTVYLKHLPEFNAYGVKKSIIEQLTQDGILPKIVCPPDMLKRKSFSTPPTIGFLLGQDKTDNGEEYYSVGSSYMQAVLNTGAFIRFLDYDNAHKQMKDCAGVILPGGAFNNPESFYIDGKTLGDEVGKRYFAYRTVINDAYKQQKPMLGICAGAQMIGALLGNMKMYRDLKQEVFNPAIHKPKEETDVRVHQIKLIKNTPIFDIMNIAATENYITINSRHNQSMVQGVLQDYVIGTPKIKMDIYAISESDNIPEIWGNEKSGILCVQGHPEDLISDKKMQNIYNYLTGKAKEYQKKHNQVNLKEEKIPTKLMQELVTKTRK